MPQIMIPQQQLKDAKLYTTRYDFIETMPKGSSYLEAGVLAGDFSEKVINTISPSEAHLVEPFFEIDWHAPEYDGPRWNNPENHYDFVFNRFKNIKNVTLHKASFEDFFIKNKNRKFDFIYMDYNTDFESVEKQIKMGTELLAEDGVLGFNDYNIYFNNTTTGEKMGVVQAINTFLYKNPEWIVSAFALNDNLTSDIYLKKLQ
jgi:hypothetical protein